MKPCQGKALFTSFDQAKAAAKRYTGRCVYRCRACQGWHVGTTNDDIKVERKFRRQGPRHRRSRW